MKNAYVPLAWFVILGSMLAAASSSLVLVRERPADAQGAGHGAASRASPDPTCSSR